MVGYHFATVSLFLLLSLTPWALGAEEDYDLSLVNNGKDDLRELWDTDAGDGGNSTS